MLIKQALEASGIHQCVYVCIVVAFKTFCAETREQDARLRAHDTYPESVRPDAGLLVALHRV